MAALAGPLFSWRHSFLMVLFKTVLVLDLRLQSILIRFIVPSINYHNHLEKTHFNILNKKHKPTRVWVKTQLKHHCLFFYCYRHHIDLNQLPSNPHKPFKHITNKRDFTHLIFTPSWSGILSIHPLYKIMNSSSVESSSIRFIAICCSGFH